jgi:hypothetical protein
MTNLHSLRHGAVLTTLLLSPILGWNGIIVAVGIVLRQFKKGVLTLPSWSEMTLADKVVAFSFFGYFVTCVFSDILHNPASGVWNQLKAFIPLSFVALYLFSPNKIRITPQALASAARVTVMIIFSLTFIEYLYFNIYRSDPGYRTQLLSGNPLHISLWIPFLTALCFADCNEATPRQNIWTVIVSFFSFICIAYFLQARAGLLTLLTVLPFGLYFAARSIINSSRLKLFKNSKTLLGTVIAAFVFVCISLASFAPERIKHILFEPKEFVSNQKSQSSADPRIAHWQTGIEAIKRQPWAGYGASKEYEVIHELAPKSVVLLQHAHQQFISFGIAGGIPAILFGTVFLFLPIFYTQLIRADSRVKILAIALSVTVVMINLTDTLITNKRHAAIFILMFVIIMSASQSNQTQDQLHRSVG